MHVLVASSSPHRQTFYRDAIMGLGHDVSLAQGGVECLHALRRSTPDLLLLETPLLWGGSDGVLEVFQDESSHPPPVILIAAGWWGDDWFHLSRFRADDFLFRVPTAHELAQAIQSVAARVSIAQASATQQLQPAPPIAFSSS
jgi:DNA-binding response OmpR family regulator